MTKYFQYLRQQESSFHISGSPSHEYHENCPKIVRYSHLILQKTEKFALLDRNKRITKHYKIQELFI